MSTLYIAHPASLDHQTPLGHPERPDRIRAIERALEKERFTSLVREQAPMAEMESLALAHPEEYIVRLRNISPREGLVRIDEDTVMSPGTYEAALRGAGGAVMAVDEVMTGRATNAFVAMRPPGHHAERVRTMGFCFFNNAAIAARHAQSRHGAERVAIFDWDVHHGNGTQDIFWSDQSVLYCSTHEAPLYPGTGALSETGEHGTIVNAPLNAGDGSEAFREAVEAAILPRIHDFGPDLIIISAGFDAHWRDPLASLNLMESDFAWATQKLMDLASRHCGQRIVSVLEGGYDLEGLAKSTAFHLDALMGRETGT
ncbi:histone deacetylase family protein [Microvirga terrae]|uniref:Histone deacetylase family protein n=1 Tax=Microvirga terrae TaxID=2740529 RepID=A0ABY5RMT9_9HYPH|nr:MULTISPECIES: histone deacetylase family protein [Microvirga]MBQ0823211.1 histone deacetylase family protein [Microvirga sp. HBU67558]UVF18525.1 histone deacetylase family protein [Microvirga terrae]